MNRLKTSLVNRLLNQVIGYEKKKDNNNAQIMYLHITLLLLNIILQYHSITVTDMKILPNRAI